MTDACHGFLAEIMTTQCECGQRLCLTLAGIIFDEFNLDDLPFKHRATFRRELSEMVRTTRMVKAWAICD